MTIKEKINYLQAIENILETVQSNIDCRMEWIADSTCDIMTEVWAEDVKAYERLKSDIEKLAEKC